jgi:hypothetical protein
MSTESSYLFEREDLSKLLVILSYVLDPDNDYLASLVHPVDGAYWAHLINWMLVYEGERVPIKMVPATLHVRDWHTTLFDQFEAELPRRRKGRQQSAIDASQEGCTRRGQSRVQHRHAPGVPKDV